MAYKAEDRPLAEEVLEHPWFGPTSAGVDATTSVKAQAHTPSHDSPTAEEKVSVAAPAVAQADTLSHDSPMAEEKVSLQAPAIPERTQPEIHGA